MTSGRSNRGTLPIDIKLPIFETLNDQKTITEFEQWVYADERLEQLLSPEGYIELIAFPYKRAGAIYELKQLLERLIDRGEYEHWRVRELLVKARRHDNDFAELLLEIYNLYCEGYTFLDNLAIGYGLTILYPEPLAESWDDLTDGQQRKLLDSFRPQVDVEIDRVLTWLDSNTIILPGELNEFHQLSFIDHRTEADKEPTSYTIP